MNDPSSLRALRTKSDGTDILFLITDLAVGGAENQVQDLASQLSERGWCVAIVSLMTPTISTQHLAEAGVPVEHLGMRRGSWNPLAIAQLRHIIRRRHPRLVHSHMVHANLLARLTKPLSRMPTLICTSHNLNEGGRFRMWALHLTDPLSDMTTHVSRVGLLRYLSEQIVRPDRAVWIPNGIDLDRFAPSGARRLAVRAELGIGNDRFLWLCIGSLTRQKAHDRLIEAFALLPDTASLVIAGGGPEASRLRSLAKRNGTHERIHFLGVRQDPEALMNAADAFVLSSSWEGLPLVLMEAGASQLPIVSTDVGGCGEIVEEGVNGYLTQSQQPVDLARAMESVESLSKVELRNMGVRGRALIQQRYNITDIVEQWEVLYKALGGPSIMGGHP